MVPWPPARAPDAALIKAVARGNFMVPVPRFATWDELNPWLEDQCRKRQADVLRGHSETFASERLTGALLDRLTHHVHILEMNRDSYRLGQSRARKAEAGA